MLASVMIIGSGSCGGGRGNNGGRASQDTAGGSEAAQTTANSDAAYDTTVDYAANAENAEINSNDEAGAGKNYVAGQKAGTIKALCYYDFANIAR